VRKEKADRRKLRDLALLNILQHSYGVVLLNPRAEAPPEGTPKGAITVKAYVKLPVHNSTGELSEWQLVPLSIRVDKMLRRTLQDLQKVYMRYMCGHVSGVTLALILTGLYAPLKYVYRFRSKIEKAEKQLKYDSRVRKFLVWRLKRAKAVCRPKAKVP